MTRLALLAAVLLASSACRMDPLPQPGPQIGIVGPLPPLLPNKSCADFPTQSDAQAFYKGAGGPRFDPHGLDRDRDGIACEDLPK